MKKININFKNKKLWLYIDIVLIVIIIVMLIILFIQSKDTNKKIEEEKIVEYQTQDFSVRNWKDYFDLEGSAISEEGVFNYTVSFKPKDNYTYEDIIIDSTINVVLRYKENNKMKFKKVTIDVKDYKKDKNGNYTVTGKYSEPGLDLIDFDYARSHVEILLSVNNMSGIINKEKVSYINK